MSQEAHDLPQEDPIITRSLKSSGFDDIAEEFVEDSVKTSHSKEDELRGLINGLKSDVQKALLERQDEFLRLRKLMPEEEWNDLLIDEAKKILKIHLQHAMQKRHEAEVLGNLANESGEIRKEISSISDDLKEISRTEKAEKEALLEKIRILEEENSRLKAENAQLKEESLLDGLTGSL